MKGCADEPCGRGRCSALRAGVCRRLEGIDLAISKTATATGKQLADVASESGRKLENQLEALKNAPPREIRTEVVKPVFTNVCLSAEFVGMYNEAAASAERALSGKPEN